MIATILMAVAAAAQTPERPVRAVTDPGVVTTRQAITPAGAQSIFASRVYGVTFGADSSEVWVLSAGQVFRLDWRNNRVLGRTATPGRAGLQGIRYDAVGRRALVNVAAAGTVSLLATTGEKAEVISGKLGGTLGGALAVSADGRRAVVPIVTSNSLAVVDLQGSDIPVKIDTGIAPFGAVLNAAGTVAYVSNWAGRKPTAKELSAPMGDTPNADRAVVDARGIAASGTVIRVDLEARKVTHSIATGLHPTSMAWDEKRGRLYVTNGNSDTVSVIDTATNQVARTIEIQPFPARVNGVAPTAVAVSSGGDRLYVACGGINAVAVVDAATGRVRGLMPTAWYPNGVAVSADGAHVAVSTLLGMGSGAREPGKRAVQAIRGSVAVIPVPDAAQLASYTTAVAENNRLPMGPARAVAVDPAAKPTAIPQRAGQPSLIEHVVYIIKENRTYDQVLGDIAKGNGDASLVMFGPEVTPNHHRIAEQFVLLDNLYANGGNSADGHQWLTQANEVDYCLWPGYEGRSYPYDGSDPMAIARTGFLWDAAIQRGRTVKIFGEYAGEENGRNDRHALLERWKKGEEFSSAWNTVAPIAPMNAILAKNFPAYTTAIPDVIRARLFIGHLKQWEREGKMPNLTLVQLPSNHTNGARPGASTPKAMVADNDLALGQIVEALSRSPFWKKMAIFVVEDDAQNGVDHVDGHRTVALVASPYARRGAVDSTFYSQLSIVKTIELILGLPSLTLFDLIANDMRASFTDTPNFEPYESVVPRQALEERNPPAQSLRGQALRDARASARMRWDVPDAAPSDQVNRMLWRMVKGTKYPGTKRSVFSPMAVEIDDDDR